MSGGDSKPKTGTKKNEPTGAIPGTSPLMTQPAFIGDNQNMLAQQLAAGGYGQVPDLMSMLNQTFTPMRVLDTRPGAAPAPSTPSTGGGTGSNPSWGDLDMDQYGSKWRYWADKRK